MKLNIVILGLSITSSWGNGHATTYRALVKALVDRGHAVTFLERDLPWYRAHRDLQSLEGCRIELYQSLPELSRSHLRLVNEADLVVVGSYVPDGIAIGDWVTCQASGITAFYDIDTPVTLAGLEGNTLDYLTPRLVPRFDIYLSFSGGPALSLIENVYASPMVRPLYCSADPDLHRPSPQPVEWSLGYLGTYSEDRQPALDELLIEPARRASGDRFVVAGAQYPPAIAWPDNVERISHLPPKAHSEFYGAQRFTLNLTRRDMKTIGFSPSVRMFEAAACGTPLISDHWAGIETVFEPGQEILVVRHGQEVSDILSGLPEDSRRAIAERARTRLLRDHTPAHRARLLEDYVQEARDRRKRFRGLQRIVELEEAK